MPAILRPATALEAQRLKDAHGGDAAFVGGGTLLQLGSASAVPARTWIDVAGLHEAGGIARTAAGLRVGTGTRLEALRRSPLVREHAPLLARACDSLAAVSVRHLATLGGNVGWGHGDTLAPLLALDAWAELADGGTVPLADWLAMVRHRLLIALHVPAHAPGWAVFEKVGHRAAFSPTRLAIALHGSGPQSARVAVAGACLPAGRLREVEAVLRRAHGVPALSDLQRACARDLADPSLARLAARIVHGHVEAAS